MMGLFDHFKGHHPAGEEDVMASADKPAEEAPVDPNADTAKAPVDPNADTAKAPTTKDATTK